MRTILYILIFALSVSSGAAQWLTKDIIFIPPQTDGNPSPLKDFVVDPTDTTLANGAKGIKAKSVNYSATTRANPNVLIGLKAKMKSSFDDLEASGFADPAIDYTIFDQYSNTHYMPIWMQALDAPAKAGCSGSGYLGYIFDWTSSVQVNASPNGGVWSTTKLAGITKTDNAQAYYSSLLNHEFTHIFARNATGDCASSKEVPHWLNEGIANGLAHHQVSRQFPAQFANESLYWDKRDYSLPFDLRGFVGNPLSPAKGPQTQYGYGTGSFFRYLAEANGGGIRGFQLLRRIVEGFDKVNLKDQTSVLEGIDKAVKQEAGAKRGLFKVLPEFLTEYGSHGLRYVKGGRYSTPEGTTAQWMNEAFDQCKTAKITPTSGATLDVTIKEFAGECIRVQWSGFSYSAGIQFAARGPGMDVIHLGESVRIQDKKTLSCFDETSKLSRRIANKMSDKCILKRSLSRAKGLDVATWTTDFGVDKPGQAFFVISNVPVNFDEAAPRTITFTASAVGIDIGAQSKIEPLDGGNSKAVQNGLVNLRSRVAIMHGGKDRLFFDGIAVFGGGEGLSYFDNAAEIEEVPGALAIIPTRNAMVTVGDPAGIGDDPDARVLAVMEGPFGSPPVVTGVARIEGDQEKEWYRCGSTEVSASSESTEALTTITGDIELFDQSKASRISPGMSECEARDILFKDRRTVRIGLPTPEHYSSRQWSRVQSRAQDAYDETDFINGPNFGGIETSRSQRVDGAPSGPNNPSDTNPNDPSQPSDPSSRGGEAGSGSSGGEAICDCSCPESVSALPPLTCIAQCAEQFAACPAFSGQ